MFDEDNGSEFNKNEEHRKKAIFYAIIATIVVLIVIAAVIVILSTGEKDKTDESSSPEATQQTVAATSPSQTAIEPSETLSASTANSTTVSTSPFTGTSQTQITQPTENVPEHGFVINNMGYTYLYYGQGFEQFNGTTKTASRYAESLNKFAEKLQGVKCFSIVAPSSVAFASVPRDIVVADNFYNSNQNTNIDAINASLSAAFTGLNIYGTLNEHASEYLYFKTDRNWTGLAAYYAYHDFAVAAGYNPVALEAYETSKFEGYLGSFYNATSSPSLLANADTVDFYLVDKLFPSTVTMYSGSMAYKNRALVYTEVSSPKSYGYYAFLGGPGERFEITTANTNGKKLLVIGDSSAFPLVPFLAAHYSEIYFCNAQAYSKSDGSYDIDKFAAEKGITDALFISYATNTQRAEYCSMINNMIS